MKGGIDEESYTHNSKPQAAYLSLTTQVIKEAVRELADRTSFDTVSIADLGCSSGHNSLGAVSEIMTTFYNEYCIQQGRPSPEFQVFLNDLPGNDFNTVFASLPKFYSNIADGDYPERIGPCYIYGVPGTFFGRLFPCKSLHFVHSSSSLHWLSQVPPELGDKGVKSLLNKGKVYISKTSPPDVLNAYVRQYQRDFALFLKSRSEEVAPGGRMVLMFRGRRVEDPCHEESCLLWDLLGQAFQDMVSQGLVAEEMLDCYNTPYYEPYTEDILSEIQKEGSFILHRLETIAIPWAGVLEENNYNRLTTAKLIAKTMRAVQESMIQNHFGAKIIER